MGNGHVQGAAFACAARRVRILTVSPRAAVCVEAALQESMEPWKGRPVKRMGAELVCRVRIKTSLVVIFVPAAPLVAIGLMKARSLHLTACHARQGSMAQPPTKQAAATVFRDGTKTKWEVLVVSRVLKVHSILMIGVFGKLVVCHVAILPRLLMQVLQLFRTVFVLLAGTVR